MSEADPTVTAPATAASVAPAPAATAPSRPRKAASKPRKAGARKAPAVQTTAPATSDSADADWSPAKTDPKTGHTLHGKYPLSGPARVRTLAAAGKTSDPDGLVSDEAIATAAKAAKARKA